MRIGYVCDHYPRPAGARYGGIRVFSKTLAHELTRLGHRVVVISKDHQIESEEVVWKDDVVKIISFRPKDWPRPRMLWQRLQFEQVVRKVVKQEQLDLVECFDEGGVLLLGDVGVPLVVRMHNNSVVRRKVRGESKSILDNYFTTRMLKRANALVAVSCWEGEQTLEAAGINDANVHVIHNGIDTNLFHPASDVARDINLILFAGAFIERKGFPVILAAMPKILSRFPNARLLCVGPDRNYPGTERKMSDVYSQDLPSEVRIRIELKNPIPHEEMPLEYQRAGLCVFPSVSEGHPFAVIEAMACGAPVVFMKQGVGPEVIEHEVDGLLCDTRSSEDLAQTVITALSDPGLRRRIGSAAAQRIRQTLSIDIIARKNIEFYEKVLADNLR